MDPTDIAGVRDSVTFANASNSNGWPLPVDDDAIKTEIATSTSPQSYSGGALNGAIGGGALGVAPLYAYLVTVTTKVSAGSYKTGAGNPLVMTGTDWADQVLTENFVLTVANGGEVVVATKLFKTITSFAPVGQNDVNGSFKVGTRDVVLRQTARQVRAGADGNLHVRFASGRETVVPLLKSERYDAFIAKVICDSLTTAYPVTVGF